MKLPAPLSRYVLVMDWGIPSHGHIRRCTQAGFRFIFRLREEWKLTHPIFTGRPCAVASRADRWARPPAAVAGRARAAMEFTPPVGRTLSCFTDLATRSRGSCYQRGERGAGGCDLTITGCGSNASSAI